MNRQKVSLTAYLVVQLSFITLANVIILACEYNVRLPAFNLGCLIGLVLFGGLRYLNGEFK